MNITAYELAQRFIGIKEISGNVHNPQIVAMLKLDNSWAVEDEIPWCFTEDIEVLTNHGWKYFKDVTVNDRVAQVYTLPDSEKPLINFTPHYTLIEKEYVGELYNVKHRDIDFTCDPKHKFYGIWNKSHKGDYKYEDREINNITSNLLIPKAEYGKEYENTVWTDNEIILMSAWLSDGFIHRGRLSIQVSKDRKINILNDLNYVHKYRANKVYGISKQILTTYYFLKLRRWNYLFTEYKVPKYEILLSWSKRQIRLFLDNYSKFDGHKRGNVYHLYTNNIKLRDWLQVAVTLAGWHNTNRVGTASSFTNKPCYVVIYNKIKAHRVIKKNNIESVYTEKPIKLYCVDVPYHRIIIRDRRGTVLVTGNCSAYVNYIAWLLRLPRSKSLAARSWLQIGTPISLHEARPAYDVVIIKRGKEPQPDATVIKAQGHVGFYSAYADGMIYLLGGNQSNSVNITGYKSDRLLGVRRLYTEV